MPENSDRIFEILTELWNTGNGELAKQIYSSDAERTDPNGPEPTRGPQQVATYVAEVRSGFPDFNLQITRRITDGDQIASEWVCNGTHRGTFLGIPPTGRQVQINGVTLSRIKGNHIVEERAYFDRLSMLQQLGVAPAPPPSQKQAAV